MASRDAGTLVAAGTDGARRALPLTTQRGNAISDRSPTLGTPRWGDLPLALFLAAVIAGLAVWAHGLNGVMPGIIDEGLYYWQAEQLLEGRVTDAVPEHYDSVRMPFSSSRDGRRFAQYPLGFALALAPWVAVGAPWMLNILLGAALLALLFRFTRRIDGAAVAWIAIVLTALSPFFICQSTIFLSHPLTLFLTLVSMEAIARWREQPEQRAWPVIAGLAMGYAFNVSPFVAAVLTVVAAERWLTAVGRARAAGTRLRAAVLFGAAASLGLVAFALTNLATTGDLLKPGYYAPPQQRAGFGAEAGPQGHSLARGLDHSRAQLVELNAFLFGWPVTSFWFAALYATVVIAQGRRRTRSASDAGMDRAPANAPAGPPPARVETPQDGGANDRWSRPLILLFVSTIVIYMFWYFGGTGHTWGPRYLYPTMPALVIFSARGVAALAALISVWSARAGFRAPRLSAAVPALLIAAFVVTGTIPFLQRVASLPLLERRRESRKLVEALEKTGVTKGTVFLQTSDKRTYRSTLLYASSFRDDRPLVYALDLGPEKNAALIEARAGSPVLYAWTSTADPEWKLLDQPVAEGERPPGVPGRTSTASPETTDPE